MKTITYTNDTPQDIRDFNDKMREKSGFIKSEDKLVSFIYELMRDHLPVGTVGALVKNANINDETLYSNGWLAEYAKYLAEILKQNNV